MSSVFILYSLSFSASSPLHSHLDWSRVSLSYHSATQCRLYVEMNSQCDLSSCSHCQSFSLTAVSNSMRPPVQVYRCGLSLSHCPCVSVACTVEMSRCTGCVTHNPYTGYCIVFERHYLLYNNFSETRHNATSVAPTRAHSVHTPQSLH